MQINIVIILLTTLLSVAKGASNQSTTSSQWQQSYRNHTQLEQELSTGDSLLETHFGAHLEPHLTRTSVIFGLTKVVNESSNVNAVCQAQLRHVQRGILSKQPWAMKGGYNSYGNYRYYRSIDQLCLLPVEYHLKYSWHAH